MAGRVEHDPYSFWVAVGWLPWCLGTASLDGSGDCGFEVVDHDLEVHHLGLHTVAFWPRRRLIPILALDVGAWTATPVV